MADKIIGGVGSSDMANLEHQDPPPGTARLAGYVDDLVLVDHLYRQREFSARTYGPGNRVAGLCDHIRKELVEVQEDLEAGGDTLAEWIDVVILGFDGAWRSGATPEQIVAALVAKQTKNEGRKWPDWRTADPNKAIEHDRSVDNP